jgi:hypothetical protein
MANEIQFNGPGTGTTCYVLIRNNVGQIWNGTSFVAYATADYTTYDVAATEQGTASNFFVSTFPSTIAAGVYYVTAKRRVGGTEAESDPAVADGTIHWNGSAIAPLSDTATSGQLGQAAPIRIYRGQMVQNFPFKMVSSADHVTPFTSGVVSGQISRDGGSFGALQSGAFTEMGLGWYRTNLTSGDLLATTVALVFTAVGISGGAADQRDIALVLQRTSGQT